MIVLCLDTATPAVTAAVVEVTRARVRTLAEHTELDARRHGELLAPALSRVLAGAGVTAREVGALAAGVGPGPFTSMRVGVVTAASMAAALDVPAYGACSLDLIAAEAGGGCLVATDARRREVYWARYDSAAARTAGPDVARPQDLLAGLAPAQWVVGGGAALYRELFASAGARCGPPEHASAGYLGGLVAERVRAGAPGERLVPLYLRRPDAVEPVPAR